jgi:hypothetical protein
VRVSTGGPKHLFAPLCTDGPITFHGPTISLNQRPFRRRIQCSIRPTFSQVLESGLPVRRITTDGTRSEAEMGPVSVRCRCDTVRKPRASVQPRFDLHPTCQRSLPKRSPTASKEKTFLACAWAPTGDNTGKEQCPRLGRRSSIGPIIVGNHLGKSFGVITRHNVRKICDHDR